MYKGDTLTSIGKLLDYAAQWLQYKILHKIIPVKDTKKKIKIFDDDDCSFVVNELKPFNVSPLNCKTSSLLPIGPVAFSW